MVRMKLVNKYASFKVWLAYSVNSLFYVRLCGGCFKRILYTNKPMVSGGDVHSVRLDEYACLLQVSRMIRTAMFLWFFCWSSKNSVACSMHPLLHGKLTRCRRNLVNLKGLSNSFAPWDCETCDDTIQTQRTCRSLAAARPTEYS